MPRGSRTSGHGLSLSALRPWHPPMSSSGRSIGIRPRTPSTSSPWERPGAAIRRPGPSNAPARASFQAGETSSVSVMTWTSSSVQNPTLNPCAQLRADARMGAGICPAGGSADLNITEQFAILSPMPHEIQGRTGHKLANPGLITLDINGNQATNGQYPLPLRDRPGGDRHPELLGDQPCSGPDALQLLRHPVEPRPAAEPRRLPGDRLRCSPPSPWTPSPSKGWPWDPRLQDPNLPHGAYNDPNFTNTALTDASKRILSYVRGTAFAGGKFNFGGNTTLLTWPPADPAALPIPVIPPVSPQQPLVTITSAPVSTTTVGQPYSYQVTAQNFASLRWTHLYAGSGPGRHDRRRCDRADSVDPDSCPGRAPIRYRAGDRTRRRV